jgi:hypothetical protein
VVNKISADFSPQELICQHCLTYKGHCRAPFGAYCEKHKDNELATKSMHSQAIPAICFSPTGNFQGSYHFLSLVSGLVIKQRTFDELPAPKSVIDRVVTLAATSGV